MVEVEPIDRLGKAEIGVDTGDHDPGIDRDQLDPDHGDPHVGVDHEALVQDQIDDVGEAARAWRSLQVVARGSAGRDGHSSARLPNRQIEAETPGKRSLGDRSGQRLTGGVFYSAP